MKKIISMTLLAAAGLFLLGWHLCQRSATKLAGEFISTQRFGQAYGQILEDNLLVQQIDSGRLEDAKQLLNLRLDGNILNLNNQLETTDSEIPVFALKILLRMEDDNQAKYGSKETRANMLFARVAKYRQEHPWVYSGKTPQAKNQDVEAKLAAILKRASETAR